MDINLIPETEPEPESDPEYNWSQLGESIKYSKNNSYFGHSVSINNNATSDNAIIAIGAPGENGGRVYVYEWNISNFMWEQKGKIFSPEYNGLSQNLGYSLCLNNTGNILVIGNPNADINGKTNIGNIRVFIWNNNEWNQLGNSISGEVQNENKGYIVKLNENATINNLVIVTSQPQYDTNSNNNVGRVTTYKYNKTTNIWDNHGTFIYGGNRQKLGTSISINGDGNILAIGSSYSSNNGYKSGKVEIYYYNINNNSWDKFTTDILGNYYDSLGYNIDINSDCKTNSLYLLVSSPTYNSNRGKVQYMYWDGIKWNTIYTSLGNFKNHYFGNDGISINSKGDRFSIGDSINNGIIVSYRYKDNNIKKQGLSIRGINNYLSYGENISLNYDGVILATSQYKDNINLVNIYNYTTKEILPIPESEPEPEPGNILIYLKTGINLISNAYKSEIYDFNHIVIGNLYTLKNGSYINSEIILPNIGYIIKAKTNGYIQLNLIN